MMMPPPEPIEIYPGRQVFIAYGRPWKDAIIALMEPNSTYSPWFYSDDIGYGDVMLTAIDTNPQVFGCIEIFGINPGTDTFGVADAWNLQRLPEVPRWTELPKEPGPLDHDVAVRLLSMLEHERWGRLYDFGIAEPASAEAARTLLNSGGSCARCETRIDLTHGDAREAIHCHLAPTNSHVGQTYSDWPAALCSGCYVQMSARGYINYLDYRLASNPQCPRCSARRSTPYVLRPYVSDLTLPETPWDFDTHHYNHDESGYWLCHSCQFRFGDPPPGSGWWSLTSG